MFNIGFGLYGENVKKFFFSETTRPRALIFSITLWTSTKFVQIIDLGPKMSPPRGQMFYIGLYRENKKKSSCLKPESVDY